MSKQTLPSDLVRLASLTFEGLDTPVSLSAAIRLRYGEWDAISDVNLDPRTYLEHDPLAYAKDAIAVNLLKKLKELPTTVDRRKAAEVKWWEGERACYLSNQRLSRYLPRFNNAEDKVSEIASFFDEVKSLIRHWIGSEPDDLAIGRFGPGATFSDRGGKTTVPDKMSSVPTLTRDAIWHLPQWLGTQWGSFTAAHHGKISFVPGNRFTTVPKTAKTDRAIAAEPSINVFYQLALGRQLRARLARRPRWLAPRGLRTQYAHWDLDSAQEVHRRVARESSATREFATLDLSNASDTVCKTLVEILLPPGWFSQLDDLRSKKTLINGRWVLLEKFSSMGNGFTFELETVIFAALSCVASQRAGHVGVLGVDVFVFGDDIIVKNDVAHPLKSVLEFCGFSLNLEKSFFGDEPFRESCGGDYFAGQPARPFYLKELPNEPQDYISYANGLNRLRQNLGPTWDHGLRRSWFAVLDCLPSAIRRLRGPQDLGDIVVHDEPSRWSTRKRNQIRYIRVYRPAKWRVVKYSLFDPRVVLASATYGCGNRREGVIPRDAVRGYKIGWVPFS